MLTQKLTNLPNTIKKLQRKKHTGTAVKKIEEMGLAPYSSTLRRSSYVETSSTE